MDSEIKVLYDKNIFPDNGVLAKHLGDTKKIYDSFTKFIHERECEMKWNYYNDGKSWLCKVTKKKKTICWISVWEKYFRITFYFGQKYDNDVLELGISDELKKKYSVQNPIGKIKPLTLEVKSPLHLEDIKTIIALKERLK